MKGRSTDWILAVAGGALLAVMIHYNSVLARHSTPAVASWMAHGIGTLGALVLVVAGTQLFRSSRSHPEKRGKVPGWAYLGGIPGAFTVWLAAVTVNSKLGLSGTLALMLVGQVTFGILSDRFGFFGVPKRRFALTDFFVVLAVLSGSAILIFFRS
ncbi:DMT family transporter [Pendulispora rubella]|uniref:DMT family transporter n=1 Tax=Pendulispora rubella TaxID=2741070 RepID=A0ABZ2KT55_9BACT